MSANTGIRDETPRRKALRRKALEHSASDKVFRDEALRLIRSTAQELFSKCEAANTSTDDDFEEFLRTVRDLVSKLEIEDWVWRSRAKLQDESQFFPSFGTDVRNIFQGGESSRLGAHKHLGARLPEVRKWDCGVFVVVVAGSSADGMSMNDIRRLSDISFKNLEDVAKTYADNMPAVWQNKKVRQALRTRAFSGEGRADYSRLIQGICSVGLAGGEFILTAPEYMARSSPAPIAQAPIAQAPIKSVERKRKRSIEPKNGNRSAETISHTGLIPAVNAPKGGGHRQEQFPRLSSPDGATATASQHAIPMQGEVGQPPSSQGTEIPVSSYIASQTAFSAARTQAFRGAEHELLHPSTTMVASVYSPTPHARMAIVSHSTGTEAQGSPGLSIQPEPRHPSATITEPQPTFILPHGFEDTSKDSGLQSTTVTYMGLLTCTAEGDLSGTLGPKLLDGIKASRRWAENGFTDAVRMFVPRAEKDVYPASLMEVAIGLSKAEDIHNALSSADSLRVMLGDDLTKAMDGYSQDAVRMVLGKDGDYLLRFPITFSQQNNIPTLFGYGSILGNRTRGT